MKRVLSILSIIVLIIVAGCSSGSSSDTSSSGSEGNDAKEVDFPTKPLQLIVPYSAGGGTDAVGRAIAAAAEKHLGDGASIGVVNKTGGGGAVGMTEGANAKNDGYTMTMLTVEVTMLPHLGLTATTYEDFTPIAQFNFDPSSIVVAADAPYQTIEEFIEYAKEHPGEIRIGNGGTGATGHLSALAMAQATETEYNHVPFEGSAPAVTALLGGHIEAASVQPAEVLPQVRAGELKVLAIMADERLENTLPDTPTFQEVGYDVPEIGVWRGVTVPKDTPEEVVTILSEAFGKAAEEEDFKTFMENNGLGIVIGNSQEFGDLMVESHEMYGELISGLDLE